MRFMILMSDDPSWDALSEAEQERVVGEHGRFEEALRASGAYVDSGRFGPEVGAAIERSADGTKTRRANPPTGGGAVGGYYVVDVADLDAALAWADRCRFIPGTNWVYPLWE